jgi:hypothetical protein
MSDLTVQLQNAFYQAVKAGAALSISHAICVSIIMYFDLSGKWAAYSLNKNRNVSWRDYYVGMKSFVVDLFTLFIPFMTFCFWYSGDSINNCTDTLFHAFIKLSIGYFLGKVWAFGVHYLLHIPALYKFHRRHHRNPRAIVASASWEDSFIEYAIMELPSFGISICFFPTHLWIHLCHFALHGWDGACGHSGFKGPGFLGWLFDGEYHYYHHAYLTINYAEMEIIDKLMGTHHSQRIDNDNRYKFVVNQKLLETNYS